MSNALQIMVSEPNNRAMPLFTRGPELEITTMQEVEVMKAILAASKIHLPSKSLERAIIMPRDLDGNHPEYPKITDMLTINPYKEKKEAKKKKGKKLANTDLDGAARMMRAGEKGLELMPS
jgi:hypothetical protein